LPRANKALVVRPIFDKPTSYGNYWLGLAAEYARRRGWDIADLDGEAATKEKIYSSLEQEDPLYCYFLGHGNADIYSAQEREYVFRTCGENARLIGRVVLFLSCSVGKRLGPDTANKGAQVVFAWKVDFTWVALGPPDQDIYSRGFFQAVNTISNAIVDGFTAREAYNKSLDVWNQWIEYWSKSTDPYAGLVLMNLVHDRDGMSLFGDETVRVTPPTPVAAAPPLWEIQAYLGQTLIMIGLLT